MSVRSVWLLSTTQNKPLILLLKHFSSVEERARVIEGDAYVAVPDALELADAVAQKLMMRTTTDKQTLSHSCSQKEEKPVFELALKAGLLWPVLIVEMNGLLYCGLPLVEKGSQTRPPLISSMGVSATFNLLLGMADFLGKLSSDADETHPRLADLYLYLNEAAPFGTPVDLDLKVISHTLQGRLISSHTQGLRQKQAAWRGIAPKHKNNTIHITITEHLRAMQYDSTEQKDLCELAGRVHCLADLDGVCPEVSLALLHPNPGGVKLSPHQPITHPTVQSVSTIALDAGGIRSKAWKLRLIPPLNKFPLCLYSCAPPIEPPIQAVYQMKGEKKVEVFIQLKRTEHLKNDFEYFEVQMPFSHRGPIINVNCTPSHGSILLSQDKKTLAWNIGQKFPSKSLELTLRSSLEFGQYSVEPRPSQSEQADRAGLTAYAQIYFKVKNYTHSGMSVDAKSVQVNPNTRCKVTTEYELMAPDFKVWNSLGDVPHTCTPHSELLNT